MEYRFAPDFGSVTATQILASMMVWILIWAAIVVFTYVCEWRIFKKIGYKGWYILCPYYNSYLLYKAVWGDGWMFLLSWIPFFNIYLIIKTTIGLGRSFGRSGWFGLGLIFFPPIFYAILAYDKNEYIGNPYEC